jgi:hypothetical protein
LLIFFVLVNTVHGLHQMSNPSGSSFLKVVAVCNDIVLS